MNLSVTLPKKGSVDKMDLEKGTLKEKSKDEGRDMTPTVVTLCVVITLMWMGNMLGLLLFAFMGCVYVSWDDPRVRRQVYGWVLFTWSLLRRVEGFPTYGSFIV
jgi:hypothetical protein